MYDLICVFHLELSQIQSITSTFSLHFQIAFSLVLNLNLEMAVSIEVEGNFPQDLANL